MDRSAVWASSEADLKQLGLVAKGDIINLKAFCIPQNASTSMEINIKKAGMERVGVRKRRGIGSQSRLESKTVHVGWKNYDKSKDTFIHVRQMKGGGSRTMTFANNTTKLDIMQALKELFFPNGKSKMGEMKDFTFEIGNYQSETIPDTFQLADYINEHCLSRTRLYLMTRKKANSWLEELCEINASGDSVDEFEVGKMLF